MSDSSQRWRIWGTTYSLTTEYPLGYWLWYAVGRTITFSGVSNDCGTRTSPQRWRIWDTIYGLAVNIPIYRTTYYDWLLGKSTSRVWSPLRESVTSVPIWLLAREEREMFFGYGGGVCVAYILHYEDVESVLTHWLYRYAWRWGFPPYNRLTRDGICGLLCGFICWYCIDMRSFLDGRLLL